MLVAKCLICEEISTEKEWYSGGKQYEISYSATFTDIINNKVDYGIFHCPKCDEVVFVKKRHIVEHKEKYFIEY